MSTELDLSHPVELVFGQVVQHAMTTTWRVHPDHDVTTADIREQLVKLIEKAAADPHNDHGARATITPVLQSRSPFMDDLFEFLNDCLHVFRDRTEKYAGSLDNWDATFVRAAEIHGCPPDEVADIHVAIKIARREMGDGGDHPDDSLYDSFLDEVNYRILGVALARKHEGVVPGSLADRQQDPKNALWPDDVLDRIRGDLNLPDDHTVEVDDRSVLSPHPRGAGKTTAKRAQALIDALRPTVVHYPVEEQTEDEVSPLKERARIAAESLQSEILTTYDHLNGVLASANQIGGVNHWRLPIKKAVEALRPTVKELRVCPTCNQPTDKDVTDA